MAIGILKKGETPVIPVPLSPKDEKHMGITKKEAEKSNKPK